MSANRREQIRMTDAEIDAFLRTRKTVILTSNGHRGHPHPMPMWFTRDTEGAFKMTTYARSQKVRNIERDPRVTLLAEDGLEYHELRAVVIEARAELRSEAAEVVETLVDIAMADLARKGIPPPEPTSLAQALADSARKRVVIRCIPIHVMSWDHRKLGGVY